MGFKDAVVNILKDSGLSQVELAEKLGKSKQSLSNILRMDHPNIKTVETIAEALGVEIEELVAASRSRTGKLQVYEKGDIDSVIAETPYERLMQYAHQKSMDTDFIHGITGIPVEYLKKGKKRTFHVPQGILAGLRDLFRDLNIDWMLTGEGEMLLTIEDFVSEGREIADRMTKVIELSGLSEDVMAQVGERRVKILKSYETPRNRYIDAQVKSFMELFPNVNYTWLMSGKGSPFVEREHDNSVVVKRKSNADELMKLAEMKERGFLTEEEFLIEKAKIIRS